MTDTTFNRFLSYGTAAQRAAFTPSPPTPASGPSPGYLWRETDTGNTYFYDTSWHLVNSAGSGIFESAGTKPVVANFTLDNAGTASMADGTFGIVLTMPSSTINIRFIRSNTTPNASFTATMRASTVTPWNTANIHNCSLIIANTARTKIINFALSGGQTVLQKWTAYNTYSGTNVIVATNTYAGPSYGWWRVSSDGTTITWSRSGNGSDWGVVATELLATFMGAINDVGFGSVNGAASGVTNLTVFDSFTLV